MKKIVINTINTHNLIKKGDRVLLALSGGSDSVSLLHILNDIKSVYGFELFACHLNHSIRKEADSDSEFVKALCDELGVECFFKKADIKEIAKREKISEELAGRNERYAFFKEISEKNNINLIATAHNKNDVAETVMMHIIRGSGIDGMKGILYKRGNIIRPLLDAKKCEIEKYCKDNGYSFVEDKTNNEIIYTRNRIRNVLIPEIAKDFNPSFIDALVRNSQIIKDDADYLNEEAKKVYRKISQDGKIPLEELKKLPKAILRRVILIMHNEYFGNSMNMQLVHTESILSLIDKGISGKSVNIDNKTRCVIESGFIYLKKDEKSLDYEYTLELNKKIFIQEIGMNITLLEWNGEKEKFFFDNIKEIKIRNRRKGDIFYPSGMTGKKKLSDYFTDCKIPLSERNMLPIITCNNELVWVINKRRDKRFLSGQNAYTFRIE